MNDTFRTRIAAAYARSGWARIALMLLAQALVWAGIYLASLVLPAEWWVAALGVVWVFAVGIAFSCLAVGPLPPMHTHEA